LAASLREVSRSPRSQKRYTRRNRFVYKLCE
jgi:hypothetical protein